MPAWPKLPTELHIGAYVQYKQKTAWLVGWLRKNSKDTNNDDPPAKPTTRQLLQQAEAIAKAPSLPADLADFSNRIHDVINLRKQVTSFYTAHLMGNAEHEFFTGKLEDIRDVVNKKAKASTHPRKRRGNKKSPCEPSDNTRRTTNLYIVLAEDVADSVGEVGSDDEAPMTSTPKPTPASTPSNADAVNEAGSELRFALLCFIYDLSLARQFVQKTWQAYKDNEVDLVTASVTTNVVIATIKRSVACLDNAAEEITPSRRGKFYSVTAAMGHAYSSISVGKGHAPYDREKGFAQFGPDMERVANLLCLPAVMHLDIYRRATSKTLGSDERLSVGENINDLEVASFLSVLGLFRSLKIKAPALDELTRFASSMTKELTAENQWACFAFQVYLDIFQCLGDDIWDGLKELVVGGQDLKTMIEDHIHDEELMELRGTRLDYMLVQQPDFSARFKDVLSHITRWTEEDVMGKALKQVGLKRSPKGDFYFLGSHPLLCGIILHTMRRLAQEVSISHTRWLIAAVAHLYNAARQVGGLEVPWKDLEYIIDFHSAKRVFVGAAPTEAELFWARRRLAFGAKLASFAPRRHGEYKNDTTNRGLVARSHLQDLIWKQQIDAREHGWLTLHQLLEHLSHNDAGAHDPSDLDNELQHTIQSVPDVSKDDPQPADTQPTDAQSTEDTPKLSQAQKKRQRQKAKKAEQAAEKKKIEFPEEALLDTISTAKIETPEIGLIPQLSTLRELLAVDELHSHFDYLSLSRRCMTLLQRLRTEVYEREVTDLVPLDAEVELPGNLDLIDRLFLELKDRPRDLTKIKAVAAIFKDFIEKEGDIELEDATERKDAKSVVWETAPENLEGEGREQEAEVEGMAPTPEALEASQHGNVEQEVDETPTATSTETLQHDDQEHEPEEQHPVRSPKLRSTPNCETQVASDGDTDDGEEQWVDAEESFGGHTETMADDPIAAMLLALNSWQE
ncbi:hypothetical protein BU16DRAFT_557730 [Lophium mytilinum]|uniref:DUF6604 domain-containing protein n=1 Tax=Lophium mytilinum TaxID=390894 RepID=A0A6A6R663_9PEZI|nr:hypothetical protein BU16DRAFT_557730 [Lophium mytilinum]